MKKFISGKPYPLENGEVIENLEIGYTTYGQLNEAGDNVIWVCHALTANSDVADWWSGLFGAERLFDPKKYFVICANAIGSCYGSSGPSTPRENKRPLLEKFPLVTTRDLARAHDLLRAELGIRKIKVLMGASLGGQQAVEWSILNSSAIEHLILLATNARHSAYGIAFNESQRLAIQTDPTFGNGDVNGGQKGLITARSIAMLSYRSYEGYQQTQTESGNEVVEGFKAASYQLYQGEKLNKRFNAYSYWSLTKTMDSHNVGRGRKSIKAALSRIEARTLVVGINSDGLFPVSEQKLLSYHIPRADYAEINSSFGHDGFLIETEQLEDLFQDFLFNDLKRYKPTVFKSTTKKSELMNLVTKKNKQLNKVAI